MPSILYFALAGLALKDVALAASTTDINAVRPREVIAHLNAKGYAIDWKRLDDNATIAVFSTEDWNKWQAEVAASSSVRPRHATTIGYPGKLCARDGESISCFWSGTWTYDSVLAGYVDGVCNGFSYDEPGEYIKTLDPLVCIFFRSNRLLRHRQHPNHLVRR